MASLPPPRPRAALDLAARAGNFLLDRGQDLGSVLRYDVFPETKTRMIRQGQIPGLDPKNITELGAPGKTPQDEAERFASAYLFSKKFGSLGVGLQKGFVDPLRRALGDRAELVEQGMRGAFRGKRDAPSLAERAAPFFGMRSQRR